jgi:flagellar hook-associated protein 1
MSSTFFGLEIGRRALSADQLALTVVGQNTANVGTPGYSRQVANLEDTDPYGAPADTGKPGQLGTGVTVASITRVRDDFLDTRLNTANADQGSLNDLRDVLAKVENAYGEPSTTGIGANLNALFSSFSDLASTPESGAVRATVLSQAQSLVAAFHAVSGSLSRIPTDINSQITSKVGQANDLAVQIAALNKQIGLSVQSGEQPNDLLDKRTALIGQLSGLVDVQVINSRNPDTNQPTGEVQIDVGGFALVQDDSSAKLPTTTSTANGQVGLVTANGVPIPLRGGEIAGLIKATTLVGGYQSDLDKLASNLISSVNALHSAGAGLDGGTGRDFFSGTGAGDISVAAAVANNPSAIAAAAPPVPPATVAPGNGDIARSLSQLSSQPVIGSASLDQFFNTAVAGIGADSQNFQTQADNQAKIVRQIQTQQSSVSGVNLDEELTKLLQYQRSYQAAARIVNVQDDVLNQIINGLGVGIAVA